MREIIPLSTLPAFEASARHESFKMAAEELNLSQAAISRQIKHLEDRLGIQLFERRHRAISLTSNGEQLHRTVGLALRLIGETVGNFRPERQNQSITITTDLAFAHFWLIPRLGIFQKSGDTPSISVMASDLEEDCLGANIDLPILYGDGNWSGYESRFLLDEEIFPVCSPSYLEHLGNPVKPEDILNGRLIHVLGGPTTWVSWGEWLAYHEVELPSERRDIELNSLPWTIQAACAGQGIALGWKYLCDDLLESGALVRPISDTLRTDRGYYLLLPHGSPMRKEFNGIYSWIMEQVSAEDLCDGPHERHLPA